jgi:hypothetical protein
MKIRFYFYPIDVEISPAELFEYLQSCGNFEDQDALELSEQDLFDALDELDVDELRLDMCVDCPKANYLELVK